jgi:multidrug efflux pump subunit AcrB
VIDPQEHPQQKGIINWFAHNHVAANLMMVFIIIMGVYGAFTITLETMPNVQFDQIIVQVPYLGAAPAEVEEGVVVKIEEAIEDVEGIKEIFGFAYEGMGQVMVNVHDDYELGDVLDEVKLAIDAISTFPNETERPIITKSRFRRGAISVQVSGAMDERVMKELADQFKDEIMSLPEVSFAEIQGARPFEISIEISEQTLRQYGLTLDRVAQIINGWSVDLPGGSIRTDGGDIRLRTKGQAYTGEEFERIVVLTREDGARVLLGDIATVRDGFAEVESYSFFNGQRSFGISVMSTDTENELDVAAAVRNYVEERQFSLPPGVQLQTWTDMSYYMEDRMTMMTENMFMGAVFVLVILSLFLHMKFAIWVIIGIPVAFLGAMMLLPLPGIGVSLNVLSTFGFILVLGIVVDDAIVVAESVYTETEKYGYSVPVVVAGARRVAVPATFGVLTTIMAFLPMLFATGPVATMSGAIAWVVILCLAFSLIESKLILPSHLAAMRSSHSKQGIADHVDRWLARVIKEFYTPILHAALTHRTTTLASFVGLLIITGGLLAGGQVRFNFFPDIKDDFVMASLELYDGAPEALVTQIVEHMTASLRQASDELKAESGDDEDIVENVFTYINDGKKGEFRVELSRSENRTATPQDLEERWRANVGEIAGAKELKFISSMHSGGGPPIAFKLTGRDYGQLEAAAADLEDHLNGFDGVYEVLVSANLGPQEVQLEIKPEAEASGITLADLGRQVRTAFYGAEAQRIQRGDQEVKVMVRYPRSERQSIGNLENMWIRTPDGQALPFAAVANYRLERGYDNIQRVNGDRAVTVTANSQIDVVEPTQVISQVNADFMPQLKAKYPGLSTDVTGSAFEARIGFDQVLTGFIISLFGIYALMAIPLKSYIQPLIIMGVIPFGIVGAVVGHLVFDIAVSSISMLGMIALSGVVVNDSLIMVDYVNKAVAAGATPTEAAIQSGAARFRAIMLTSLTTFFGLIPIVLETSAHAQMVIPMAVSLASGILFATLITLILVPTLYIMAEDVRKFFGPGKSTVASASAAE